MGRGWGWGWGFHLIHVPSPNKKLGKKISPSLSRIRNWVWNYPHTLSEWEKSPRVLVPVEIFAIPNKKGKKQDENKDEGQQTQANWILPNRAKTNVSGGLNVKWILKLSIMVNILLKEEENDDEWVMFWVNGS